jgi:hypothetical protein
VYGGNETRGAAQARGAKQARARAWPGERAEVWAGSALGTTSLLRALEHWR